MIAVRRTALKRLGVRLERRRFVGGSLATATLLVFGDAWPQPAGPVQSGELTDLTIAELARLIRARAVSPVELTRAYLERIERLEPQVNAYVTVTADLALKQARELETELENGRWRGPLHGIPIGLKDNIDTAGVATTAASALYADRVPGEDAEVYRRLQAAGAVLLGKLNMHEFAYGLTSAISHVGPVRNPWSRTHVPGGSSGGSAAAVSAAMCCGALGTDTGGSIRQPAAFCGIVGLKPTYGLVSIRGVVPAAESLDHVGPMCRSVGDCALLLQAIAGYDPRDPVSLDVEPPAYADALERSTAALRLGIPRAPYFDRLTADVAAATDEALRVLRGLTGEFRDVTLPRVPDFSTLLAEAYAYHERHLADPAERALYQRATLERIQAAGDVSMTDYFRARRELALARRAITETFADVDLLITPTAPDLPGTIASAESPSVGADAVPPGRNTLPFNLYGIPTISIPCGFGRSGLPIGLQISGPRLGEIDVLALAHAYEQATDWHRRSPPL